MNVTPALSRGEWFPSLGNCALVRGVSPKTVDAHLRRHGHLERVGIGQGRGKRLTPHHRSKPVCLGPEKFPSRRAAARALGVGHATICRWLSDPAHYAPRILAALMAADARKTARKAA